MKLWIGIDNGVTGSIGFKFENGEYMYIPMPVKSEQDYTKKKQNLNRVVVTEFQELLEEATRNNVAFIMLERPMVNPQRWKASVSAIRCDEAAKNVIELLQIPFEYIDSKEWQKVLLPQGIKKEQLKKASTDIGKRLFPKIETKLKDYDGLLIAEYCRRKHG